MFTRGRSRVWSAVLVLALLSAFTPNVALAQAPPEPTGTSATNPSYPGAPNPDDFDLRLPDDPDGSFSYWRGNWGSSRLPEFTLDDPLAGFIGGMAGFYYVVDRSKDTTLSLTSGGMGAYYHATRIYDGEESRFQARFDVVDVYENDAPAGGWVYTEPLVRRLPYEGSWYLHLKWYDLSQTDYDTLHIPVRIDMTAPLPVSKITARPSLTYAGATNRWFSTSRAHVTWEDKEYDAMAGVTGYRVYVDGDYHSSVPAGKFVFTSATIEHLAGGKHVIDVYALDHAGNISPKATTFFYADPDEPVLEITQPSDGGKVGLNAVFKAKATDEAGIQWVDFAIDGVSFYTDKTPPYQASKYMGAYTAGTHTVTVTTKDMYGREVSKTHSFTVDKTLPVLGSVSDSPDPFYPMIVDGYKDSTRVSFWCSEGGTAKLTVYDATGQVYATRSKSIGSGWQSLTWDGVSKYGRKGTGTFRYKVTVTDAAGNATSAGLYTTTIRDYEIIRIAPNAVKVVPR